MTAPENGMYPPSGSSRCHHFEWSCGFYGGGWTTSPCWLVIR